MSKPLACKKCGAEIDPSIAELTGRLCVSCKYGQLPHVELNLPPPPSTILSMDEYLDLVRSVPLPSVEQRQNFINYVATAHSWYKHLPPFLPGAPFYFFIDPTAGGDWLMLPDGSYEVAERKMQGFHYSAIPTAEYRERFGYLSYATSRGAAVFSSEIALSFPRDKLLAIPGEGAKPCYVPGLIQGNGRVELTAVIHPNFVDYPFFLFPKEHRWWQSILPDRQTIQWPEQSGGQATLKKILDRVAYMRTPEWAKEKEERIANLKVQAPRGPETTQSYFEYSEQFVDPVLLELIVPERGRQRLEMLKAIDRVCSLIDPGQQAKPGYVG